MIISELIYHQRYLPIHHLFKAAFSYLENTNLTILPEGRAEIDGDQIFAIAMKPGTFVNNTPKPEIHNKYLDIHFIISGTEIFGWKPASNCLNPEGEFNIEKDFQLYNDHQFERVMLKKNHFVIVYPEDAHVPCVITNELTKIVLKIKI